MTPRLSPEILDALDGIRAASQRLIGAARAEDPDSIGTAVDERAGAVERLQRAIDHARGAMTDGEKEQLQLSAAVIADEAAEAEAALRKVMESTRDALQALARGIEAARRYGAEKDTSTALDRSG